VTEQQAARTATAPDETQTRRPLPWSRSCYVCGEANPIGLRARSYLAGDWIEMPFVPRIEHAGWNDTIHGGFIATVLDEVMTWAANVGSQQACYSAEFTIRILQPLQAGTSCVARARMAAGRRRIFDIVAELHGEDGTLYARGSGRYMPVPAGQVDGLRKDLVTDPSCVDVGQIFQPPDQR
jgi:acyl-coenzyme A thioesterase PaaI-like protein